MFFLNRATSSRTHHGVFSWQRVLLIAVLASLAFGRATIFASTVQAQTAETTVSGFVYYDLNGNGQWDPAEPRAAHVLVDAGERIPETRSLTVSTTTDANGNYSVDLTSVLTPALTSGAETGGVSAGVANAVGMTVASGGTSFQFFLGQGITVNVGLHFVGSSNGPTGFVTDSIFQQFFDRRGGVATFGYAISRLFLFQGFPTQIFQRAVLQRWPDGSVHLLNLLDPGLIPFNGFNGAEVPAFDPSIVTQAPAPGSPDYSRQILDFIASTVPDSFAGQKVDFHQTFLATVTAASVFPPVPPPAYCQKIGIPLASCTAPPGYGDPALLPGFDLEIWGIPTSHPLVDPNNNQFIYQRFQRGIMHYQANLGVTEGLLLGDYFKSVLTGQNLSADLAQEANASPFLQQYCRNGVGWICRPQDLSPTSTDLTGAFETEPAISN